MLIFFMNKKKFLFFVRGVVATQKKAFKHLFYFLFLGLLMGTVAHQLDAQPYSSGAITVTPLGAGKYRIDKQTWHAYKPVLFRFYDGSYMVTTTDVNKVASVTRFFKTPGGSDTSNYFLRTHGKNSSGGTDDDRLAYEITDTCVTCTLPSDTMICPNKNNELLPANFALSTQIDVVDVNKWKFYVILTINAGTQCESLTFSFDTKNFFEYTGRTDYHKPNGELIPGITTGTATNGTVVIDAKGFNKNTQQRNIYFRFEILPHSEEFDPDNPPELNFSLTPKDCETLTNKDCSDSVIVLNKTVKGSSHDPNSLAVNKTLVCLSEKKQETFKYTLHFQNEGRGTAHSAEIEIPIDTAFFALDIASVQCTVKGVAFRPEVLGMNGSKIQIGLKEIHLEGLKNRSAIEKNTEGTITFNIKTKKDIEAYKEHVVQASVVFVDIYKKDYNFAPFEPPTPNPNIQRQEPVLTNYTVIMFDNCPVPSWSCWIYILIGVIIILLILLIWLIVRYRRNRVRNN